MPKELELLPVLHARGGHLVDPDGEPIEADLRTLARDFKREYGAVYHVDLDGLQRNKPDMGLVQELAKASPLWADCGSRFHTDVMDLMVAGAEQVTLRYETLKDRSTVEEVVRISEQVALGMEFRDQELVPNDRWPATPPELVQLAERFELPLVVVDLDAAGRASGVDKSVAWHARHHGPGAYFAGGVAKRRDLDALADMGYRGALVSTALLQGAELSGKEWPGPPGYEDAEASDEDPGMDPDMGGIL